jgi:MoaA/NifB/PqqE/SkfB family radical SAM enzyme
MPLEEVHIVLTYNCLNECSHCFCHCAPNVPGTFTVYEMEGLIEQAAMIEGVSTVFFEGGEPMLYYPLVERGIILAGELGLDSGLVSCGYYATTPQDGKLWLSRLRDKGLKYMDVSADRLHGEGEAYTHAANLAEVGRDLGIEVNVITISDPRGGDNEWIAKTRPGEEPTPAHLRGRAAHDLVEGLPLHNVDRFIECPFEELKAPNRVHVDPFGNVHICQGILAGNVWEKSLARVVNGYNPQDHPVLGPLIEGGPAALARATGIGTDGSFATECHACYEIRRTLRPDCMSILGPAQVYGEEPEPPPENYV